MTVDLRPSFLRTLCSFFLVFGALTALFYVFGTSSTHAGDSQETLLGSLLVSTLLGSLVWFFFVPRRLEFSDTQFTIKAPLGRLQTFRWDELEYFGPGRGVFVIQFLGCSSFQIFTFGFPHSKWRLLKRFLYDNFPDRAGSFSIGGRFIN